MWAAIILIFFIGTLKLLTNAHVARGRLTVLKYVFLSGFGIRNGSLHELVKAMAIYTMNSVRHTNEHKNEITNEISAKQ